MPGIQQYNGAFDDRSKKDKKKDFQHSELFGMASPLEWKEKTFKFYSPQRHQDGSGACGGFSGALALGINEFFDNGKFEVLSPAYIYQQRTNDGMGMPVIDLCNALVKKGSPKDPLLSSDNLNEVEINSLQFTQAQIEEALKYKGLNYLFINKDIDTIASVIAGGHAPIFLLRCMDDEYTVDPKVLHPNKVIGQHQFNINHYITGTDYGMRNGSKVIPVQESWKDAGLRYFTQDFITNRVELIFYIIDLPTEVNPSFSYTFTTPLFFGQNSPMVAKLQEMLASEALFPKDLYTGYYGNITASAVKKWQIKHSVASMTEINQVAGKRFYKKSIDKANQLYSS